MAKRLRIDISNLEHMDTKAKQLLQELARELEQTDAFGYDAGSAGAMFAAHQKQLQQLKSTVGSVKRSLMGFDQINRLVAKSSGSAAKSTEKQKTAQEQFLDALLDKDAAEELGGMNGELALRYHELQEQLAAGGDRAVYLRSNLWAMIGALQGAMGATQGLVSTMAGMGAPFAAASASAEGLWESLTGLSGGLYTAEATAVRTAQSMQGAFLGMDGWFKSNVSQPVKQTLATLFDGMAPEAKSAWTGTKDIFKDAGGFFTDTFKGAWTGVMDVFSDKGSVFTSVKDGVLSGFKQVVNGLIGGLNEVVATPFSGVNDAFEKLRDFTLDGKALFKNLNFSVAMPKIPFLASGAVLPANKPFLAMVGDQKHGTNIEAPLETIQQAVAAVMNDQLEAQLAGHSATVQVLRQILEAVLGISLDEGAVSRAVERHQNKMAVVTGGF